MNVRYHDHGTITEAGRRVVEREAAMLDRRLMNIQEDLRVLDVTIEEHLRDGSVTAKINLHVLDQSISASGTGAHDDTALRLALGRLEDGLARFMAKLRGEPTRRREARNQRDAPGLDRDMTQPAQDRIPTGG